MGSNLSRFLAELKRRRVYRAATVYVVAGAGIIGLGEAALPSELWGSIQIPVGVVILAGLPIALILAWAYELGPEESKDPAAAAEEVSEVLPGDGTKSLVVLPFENLSPDPDNAFFADGLTEELIADLSKIRSLRVISRTSAFSLKGSQKDLRTIARELNVRFVLEGSVRRAGTGLRITAQLIDGETDTHLWAEKYSGTLDDVFDLEEQLSRRIVDGMKVSLSDEEDRQLSARPIPHVGAYEHYLRARPNIFAFDARSVEAALRDLEAGLTILGENVHLLKGLGMALFQQLNAGLSEDEGVVGKVEECARRIEAMAPDDAAAFMIRGLGRVIAADFPGAVSELREAYRRDPSDPDTILWLGVHSLSTGQMDVAERLIKKLKEVDPLAPLSSLLVSYLAYFQGRFSDAADLQEEALLLGPDVLVSLWCAVRTFIAADRPNRATECAAALKRHDPDSPFSEASGLLVMGLEERTGPMPEASSSLRTWATRDGEWAQYLSDAYAFGGDDEKALEWLEAAREAGFFNHEYLSRQDPFTEALRGSEEWTEALDRIRSSHRRFEATLQPLPSSARGLSP